MSNAVMSDWPSGVANTGWPSEPSGMFMPGRIQGWPAGTQRAANAAQRLLSQAVAWWDVEQYRDGDRFLRNRGTAGELLDLRLGSSIVANSNDPQYLPALDLGYVALPGLAGNSLSMTAPATATQFSAYPTSGAAASTGSVTGGATFTFTTSGSWLKIELLDASNVVLDTIDCDAITSGSNTSFASALNQTVSVNRSTSGRKSVAVPSRHKGGRPVMLLGTDDWLEIPSENGWQHGLLNMDKGQSFTVVAFVRQWATSTDLAGFLVKSTTATYDGWALAASGSGISFWAPQNVGAPTQAMTMGAVSTIAGVVDVSAQTRAANVDGTANTLAYAWNSGMLARSLTYVGVHPPTSFGAFEFYGGAVFRRALSTRELLVLSNDATRRIA